MDLIITMIRFPLGIVATIIVLGFWLLLFPFKPFHRNALPITPGFNLGPKAIQLRSALPYGAPTKKLTTEKKSVN
jgi:hypothetical protein